MPPEPAASSWSESATGAPAAYWSKPVTDLTRELQTTVNGLPAAEARARLAQGGRNSRSARGLASPLSFLRANFAARSSGQTAPDARVSLRSNVVFTGTSVRSGTATVLVVKTGNQAEFAGIAAARHFPIRKNTSRSPPAPVSAT